MGVDVTIDLAAANRVVDGVASKARAAARRGMVSAAARLVSHIQTVILPGLQPQPVDRGIYKAAWHVAEQGADALAVTNSAPHAPIVEWGARAENVRPSRKMLDALAEWVRRKQIGATVRTSSSGRRTVQKATDAEARAIAWAIVGAMRKRGIFGPKGLRVAEKAAAQLPRFLHEEIAAELARAYGGK